MRFGPLALLLSLMLAAPAAAYPSQGQAQVTLTPILAHTDTVEYLLAHYDPASGTVYAVTTTPTIRVIDISTGAVTAEYALSTSYGACASPVGSVLSHVAPILYVACQGDFNNDTLIDLVVAAFDVSAGTLVADTILSSPTSDVLFRGMVYAGAYITLAAEEGGALLLYQLSAQTLSFVNGSLSAASPTLTRAGEYYIYVWDGALQALYVVDPSTLQESAYQAQPSGTVTELRADYDPVSGTVYALLSVLVPPSLDFEWLVVDTFTGSVSQSPLDASVALSAVYDVSVLEPGSLLIAYYDPTIGVVEAVALDENLLAVGSGSYTLLSPIDATHFYVDDRGFVVLAGFSQPATLQGAQGAVYVLQVDVAPAQQSGGGQAGGTVLGGGYGGAILWPLAAALAPLALLLALALRSRGGRG